MPGRSRRSQKDKRHVFVFGLAIHRSTRSAPISFWTGKTALVKESDSDACGVVLLDYLAEDFDNKEEESSLLDSKVDTQEDQGSLGSGFTHNGVEATTELH